MEKALKSEGIALTHLIGPKTAHAYHPETRVEVARRVDAMVDQGRNPAPFQGALHHMDPSLCRVPLG